MATVISITFSEMRIVLALLLSFHLLQRSPLVQETSFGTFKVEFLHQRTLQQTSG
jgi:hypothetical protein